ncbi:M48 family metalloprotease, partial [Acinetobacter radioresistens]|uniref:M48 family metalloprotease n=2 Tax=Acinetobacter TaxID=469 RepID=UPI003984BD65
MKKFLLAAGLSSLTTFSPALTFDAPSSFGQVEVPDIGGGVGLIDQQQERFIGEKVYREVHKQMPVMQNPWLEDQLYSIFTRILSQTQAGQPIGLVLIKDSQINAFAVPGGLFAINTGMVTSARNIDEVAGVMAHEIAHVTQRHYSRSKEAFKGQGLLALAGVLVGAAIASQADGEAGTAVMLGTQAALMDKQLTYSRNQEREADRIGMQYMYSAGYNPQGMADFFEL